MFHAQATAGQVHILKPDFGTDLMSELQDFVHEQGITLASISGVGGVRRATLRYYDQQKKEWLDIEVEKELEVVSLLGNVSLLNGQPIAHVHITLSDEEGRCYGGHVGPNTQVFNMEIFVTTMSGANVTRKLDPDTKLTLWVQS